MKKVKNKYKKELKQMIKLGWIKTEITMRDKTTFCYGNSFCSNFEELLSYVKFMYSVDLIKKLAIHNMESNKND